jgi:hypothetical protein
MRSDAINTTQAPHPIYFLVRRTDERGRANLTAIKDESTGKRFACVFVSFHDAQEFMVANDLTFDNWKIFQAHSPAYVQGRCYEALHEGIYEAVINPPPVIRGVWRTLSITLLPTWSRKAKEPLLAWAGYEVPPVPHKEAKK